jgi:hypothetical protein
MKPTNIEEEEALAELYTVLAWYEEVANLEKMTFPVLFEEVNENFTITSI